ncbi:MAG: hypothetical protein ACRELY_28930 [Polyangiaceae bacterium]
MVRSGCGKAFCAAYADGAPRGDSGGGDSDSGGDQEGGSVCDEPHDLCDDFDEPGEVAGDPSKWTSAFAPNPAFLTLSTSQYDSPPASLAAFYEPDAGGDFQSLGIDHDFTGSFVHAHCSFHVRVGAVDTSSSILYATDISAKTPSGETLEMAWAVWVGSSGGGQSIELDQDYVDGGESDDVEPLDDDLTLRTWYHGSLDVSIPDAGPPVFSLFINGHKVSASPSGTWSSLSNFEVVIGATGDPSGSSDHVYFDDFYCDLD